LRNEWEKAKHNRLKKGAAFLQVGRLIRFAFKVKKEKSNLLSERANNKVENLLFIQPCLETERKEKRYPFVLLTIR